MADTAHILPMQERALFLSRHQADIQSYRMVPFWTTLLIAPAFFHAGEHAQRVFTVAVIATALPLAYLLRRVMDARIGWASPNYRALRAAEPPMDRRNRRWRMVGYIAITLAAMCALHAFNVRSVLETPYRPQSALESISIMWPVQAMFQCICVVSDHTNPKARRSWYILALATLVISWTVGFTTVNAAAIFCGATGGIMIAAALTDVRLLLQLAPPRDEREAA